MKSSKADGAPARKASKAEVLKRVEAVFGLRLGGAEYADIVQYASAPEQGWDVSERQLWNYIRAADALVKKRFDARAEHLLARHLLQRRQLYAHAMGAGDFGTALRVLQDEAKLEGLYPPTKIAPTSPDGEEPYEPGGFEPDEVLGILRGVAARLGCTPARAPGGQPAQPP
jgi:hypothetical protein